VDINEHLDTLRQYANEVSHITEFGVREAISTLSFLLPSKKIISYDIKKTDRVDYIMGLCKSNSIDWTFYERSTTDIDPIDPTELLFVDTLHTYDQVSKELQIHGKQVSKYIIFHDTESFGSIGMDGKPGINKAILEFLCENKEWVIKEIYHNNNGLLILEKH
jgi:hypothetical protein